MTSLAYQETIPLPEGEGWSAGLAITPPIRVIHGRVINGMLPKHKGILVHGDTPH